MQICTNWACLIFGILAIILAVAFFYLIGLFFNKESKSEDKIKDKAYRTHNPENRPDKFKEKRANLHNHDELNEEKRQHQNQDSNNSNKRDHNQDFNQDHKQDHKQDKHQPHPHKHNHHNHNHNHDQEDNNPKQKNSAGKLDPKADKEHDDSKSVTDDYANQKKPLTVELVTVKDCEQCPKIKDIFNKLKKSYNINLIEHDARDDRGHYLTDKYDIRQAPGIIINDEFFSSGKATEEEIIQWLEEIINR